VEEDMIVQRQERLVRVYKIERVVLQQLVDMVDRVVLQREMEMVNRVWVWVGREKVRVRV